MRKWPRGNFLQEITPAFLSNYPLPHHRDGDKHDRGRVLVIGGNIKTPGAALLASMSALRAGAGILRIATCEAHAPHLAIAMPEAMVIGCPATQRGEIHPSASSQLIELATECDAVLVGPGMIEEDTVAEIALALLAGTKRTKFVLDAAAFTCLRAHLEKLNAQDGRLVVTPHAGEMAKFLGESREDVEHTPLGASQKASILIGAIVVLKGSITHITSPAGESWYCQHGCIGLATSGSGDTLGGIIAGLLARGMPPALAALWSVYVHADAGRRLTTKTGSVGFLAREIPAEIPMILEALKDRRDPQ